MSNKCWDMVAAIYRNHSYHDHHKASLNNSEVVCGFPHLLRVIHYEIVVLDQEQFTSMAQMLMCCSNVGLQW
jgi:hypothetical protein